MTKGTVISLVVVVVAVAAWVIFRNAKESIAPILTPTLPILSPTPSEGQNRGSSISQPSPSGSGEIGTTPSQQANTVIYTDSGYSPATITIKKGQTVVWKNNSSYPMWTASALHPTHKVYPGTDISACGTQMLIPMFDTCVGTPSGQSWSFTFVNTGTWKYHNHKNPAHYGTVIVEPRP